MNGPDNARAAEQLIDDARTAIQIRKRTSNTPPSSWPRHRSGRRSPWPSLRPRR
jgi:hypothetical protein